MARSPIVVVKNLVKRYGRTLALKGVSFKVYRGEIYGLLGPNGAGKTTIIRALIGALKPTSGKILVLGHDSFRESLTVRRLVGIVPELPSLYPELTVRDNLYYVARIHGMNRIKVFERLDHVAGLLGLERILDRRYGVLSKGLKRRVDIAAAMIHDPELLLLDEPTSGLDPIVSAKIREAIQDLVSQGKTIILTSHYIHEAMELSNRVLLLHRGTKVIEDEPASLARILRLSKTIRIRLHKEVDRSCIDRLRRELGYLLVDGEIRVSWNTVALRTNRVVEVLDTARRVLTGMGYEIIDLEVVPPSWEDVFRGFIEPVEEGCDSCPVAAMGGCGA